MTDETRHPDPERREGGRRKIFRFDPTVSSGTLILVAQILFGFVAAYGVYQSDRTRDEMRFEQLRKDVDGNRTMLSGNVQAIQADVKDVQKTLQDVATNIAVLKARQDPMSGRRPMDEGRR